MGGKATIVASTKAECRLDCCIGVHTGSTVHSRSALAPVKISFEWIGSGARPEREWTVTASVNAFIEMHVTLLDRTVTGARAERDRTYSVNQA